MTTLQEAARHRSIIDPGPAFEAIKTAGRWIADLVIRATQAMVRTARQGHIPDHQWGEQRRTRADLLRPTLHPVYTGKDIATATVRAMSLVAAGHDPIKLAVEALREIGGGRGLQIAEDTLTAWLHRDRRLSLRMTT